MTLLFDERFGEPVTVWSDTATVLILQITATGVT